MRLVNLGAPVTFETVNRTFMRITTSGSIFDDFRSSHTVGVARNVGKGVFIKRDILKDPHAEAG